MQALLSVALPAALSTRLARSGLSALALACSLGPVHAASLNPELVDGLYLQASGEAQYYGVDVNSASLITSPGNFNGDALVIGGTSGVSAGGAGVYGAFVDFQRGLMGGYAGAPAGNNDPHYGELAQSWIIFNMTTTGIGHVSFELQTRATVTAATDDSGAAVSLYLREDGYHFANGAVDPFITFAAQELLGHTCTGLEGCPTNPDSAPIDLFMDIPVDAQRNQFQITMLLQTNAVGPAAADSAHTAAITMNVSPGVTVDLPPGFLSVPQSPEPDYFGNRQVSPVPEPGTLACMAVGLAVVAAKGARRRREPRGLRHCPVSATR
jgi:hypothetical protein